MSVVPFRDDTHLRELVLHSHGAAEWMHDPGIGHRLIIGIPGNHSLDEPRVVLSLAEMRVEITLSYWHHMRNWGGWRADKDLQDPCDVIMSYLAEVLERKMWEQGAGR